MELNMKMKTYGLKLTLILIATTIPGSMLASRYQEAHLTRYYYSGPEKLELVGEADLFCPDLEWEKNWIMAFGIETPYYETISGAKCRPVSVEPNPPPWPPKR